MHEWIKPEGIIHTHSHSSLLHQHAPSLGCGSLGSLLPCHHSFHSCTGPSGAAASRAAAAHCTQGEGMVEMREHVCWNTAFSDQDGKQTSRLVLQMQIEMKKQALNDARLFVASTQVKMLQLRGVMFALRAQHAQHTAQRVATGVELSHKSNVEAAKQQQEAERDSLEARLWEEEGGSEQGRPRLFSGERTEWSEESTEITSWVEDQHSATAQLLRTIRARVLRLCAASLPSSSAPTHSSPVEPDAAPPAFPSASNIAQLSAAGGVVSSMDGWDTAQTVLLLREMLELGVPWTAVQG